MTLGLKEAIPVLDLWQALFPAFSAPGGSASPDVAEAGGADPSTPSRSRNLWLHLLSLRPGEITA